jgi:hypothetical protein
MALNFTVRQSVMFLQGCRGLIGLIPFVVDPGMLKRVLKHGVQAVWNLSLTCRDGIRSVLIITCVWYSQYIGLMVFPFVSFIEDKLWKKISALGVLVPKTLLPKI